MDLFIKESKHFLILCQQRSTKNEGKKTTQLWGSNIRISIQSILFLKMTNWCVSNEPEVLSARGQTAKYSEQISPVYLLLLTDYSSMYRRLPQSQWKAMWYWTRNPGNRASNAVKYNKHCKLTMIVHSDQKIVIPYNKGSNLNTWNLISLYSEDFNCFITR